MDCLQNRIGLLGCGITPSPDVQLYINQLPGITIDNIDALADYEQETFVGVWSDVQLRVMKKFIVMVKAKLNKCYKITDNTIVTCLVCEKKELFDVALWYLHGVELMIERTSTDIISRFTTVDLEKAEKLKAEFYIEFESALDDAIGSLNPSESDCVTDCLECNDSVKWIMQTP